MRRKNKTFRWLLALLLVVALLGGVLAVLPRILSTAAAKDWVLAKVNARVPGKVDVGAWALTWRKGIEVRGISYAGPQGPTLFAASRVSVSRGLWHLIRDPYRLDRVEIDQPILTVPLPETRPAGPPEAAEAEARPAPPARREAGEEERAAGPPSPLPEVHAEFLLRGGTLNAVPFGEAARAVLINLDLRLEVDGWANPLRYTLACRSGDERGRISCEGLTHVGSDFVTAPAAIQTDTRFEVEGWELEEALSVLAARNGFPRGRGRLDGRMTFTGSVADGLQATGKVTLADLELSGGFLKGDTPSMKEAAFELEGALQDKTLSLSKLTLESPLASMTASGVYGARAEGAFNAEAVVDLAVVFAQFPETLRLQKGLQLTEGKAVLAANIESAASRYAFHGQAYIERIAGRLEGKQVAWDEPSTLAVKGEWGPEVKQLESFSLRSSFLQGEGRGDLNDMQLRLTADLHAAMQELRQWVHLDDWDVQGRLNLGIAVNAEEDKTRKLVCNLSIENAALSQRGASLIPPSNLRTDLSTRWRTEAAAGGTTFLNPALTWQCWLGSGRIGMERLQWRQEAAASEAVGVEYGGSVDLAGLTPLLHHTEHVPPEVELSGRLLSHGQAAYQERVLALHDMNVNIAQPTFSSHGKAVRDTEWAIVTQGRVDTATRSVSLPTLDVTASPGRLTVQDLVVADWADLPGSLTGKASAQMDLGRLLGLLEDFTGLDKDMTISASTRLALSLGAGEEGRQAVRFDTAFNDLRVQAAGQPPLSEKVVTLAARVQKDRAGEGLLVDEVALLSTPLSVRAAGRFKERAGTRELEASGSIAPELQSLAAYLRAFAGLEIEMDGKEEKPFTVKAAWEGPGWAGAFKHADLRTGLHADRIKAFGLDMAGLDVPIAISNGVGTVSLNATVNQGTLSLQPTVNLAADPPVILFPADTNVLSNAQLTPDLADQLLALLHPVFKGASVVQGSVDIHMDHFSWPLPHARRNDAAFAGTMYLKQVKLGASGLLNGILELTKVRERELDIGDREIRFTCRNGRIECSPMELGVEGYQLVLAGTVGLDQSLDYTAQVPVTPRLVGENVYKYVQGTSIRVPIRGTISKPELSSKVMTDAVADLVQQAARKALQGAAGDALKKLFE